MQDNDVKQEEITFPQVSNGILALHERIDRLVNATQGIRAKLLGEDRLKPEYNRYKEDVGPGTLVDTKAGATPGFLDTTWRDLQIIKDKFLVLEDALIDIEKRVL